MLTMVICMIDESMNQQLKLKVITPLRMEMKEVHNEETLELS